MNGEMILKVSKLFVIGKWMKYDSRQRYEMQLTVKVDSWHLGSGK